jgi:hypothetical protein
MTYLDLPERSEPRVSPQLLVGAASPLWGYFGAAAAGGVAFWWMTRWARPVNLEALFEATMLRPAETAVAAALDVEPQVVEAVGEMVAPMDAVAEAASDPVVETAPPEPSAFVPEPAPEVPALEPETPLQVAAEAPPESTVTASSDPVVEAQKPRVRRPPPPATEG